jgi:hypothetical protein
MDEISLFEWLKRLNMSKYAPNFAEQRISQISDMRFVDE